MQALVGVDGLDDPVADLDLIFLLADLTALPEACSKLMMSGLAVATALVKTVHSMPFLMAAAHWLPLRSIDNLPEESVKAGSSLAAP